MGSHLYTTATVMMSKLVSAVIPTVGMFIYTDILIQLLQVQRRRVMFSKLVSVAIRTVGILFYSDSYPTATGSPLISNVY